jgi:transposase
MAGVRGKAAAPIGASEFPGAVRDKPRTPRRRFVHHLACTAYLTLMHTGDRSADAIDTGAVLPGYTGILVRDGYNRYKHLTGAQHAWCGAHLLRDLKDVHDIESATQERVAKMACLLLWARDAAAAARREHQTALDPAVLDELVTRYRAITAEGGAVNQYQHHSANARAARALARRFGTFEDMILRFATLPALNIFTNNEAELTIRPSRSSNAAP